MTYFIFLRVVIFAVALHCDCAVVRRLFVRVERQLRACEPETPQQRQAKKASELGRDLLSEILYGR